MAKRRRAKFAKGNLTAVEAQNYADYHKGERIHTVGRKPASAKLQRRDCGVIPFGLTAATTVTAADRVRTTITGQAADIVGVIGGINYDDFGIESNMDNVSGTIPAGQEFFPALCKPTLVAKSDLGKAGTGTSAFTGRPRGRQYNTRSGSIPFGKTTKAGTKDAKTSAETTAINEADYEDVRTSLLKKIKDGLPTTGATLLKTITFEPEIFRVVSVGGVGGLNEYTAGTISFT